MIVQTAKASAKVILLGEHSVVSRGCAISLPLPQLSLSLTPISQAPARSEHDLLNGALLDQDSQSKLQALKLKIGISPEQRFSITSTIPLGRGLGSSAAITVALLRSMDLQIGTDQLIARSIEGEKVFHGKPSGIDPCTVALEKAIAFWPEPLRYHVLNLNVWKESELTLVICDSGETHNTAEAVAKVESLKTRKLWDLSMNELAGIADQGREIFETTPQDLGELMNQAHSVLNTMDVSTPKINGIVDEFLQIGAIGAKLSGAGCGGVAIGLFQGNLPMPILSKVQTPNAGLWLWRPEISKSSSTNSLLTDST